MNKQKISLTQQIQPSSEESLKKKVYLYVFPFPILNLSHDIGAFRTLSNI